MTDAVMSGSWNSVLETPRLRALDLPDRAIHDLVLVVAYFNFVNRIASGLAVELEVP